MKQQIKVARVIGASISPDTIVKFRVMGTVRELQTAPITHREPVTRKISADEFVDVRTGEIIEVQHQDSRACNLRSVAQSLKHGRDMINANITCHNFRCVRWVTLTYAENMTDPKRLHRDFVVLRKRLMRRYGAFEYISCAEPQQRGAWHLHCLFIFPKDAPYIPNEVLREMWGQGFVNIKALPDGCDNIGAYLTAYLGDLPLEEYGGTVDPSRIKTVEIEPYKGEKSEKRFVKGARMKMYPTGMQIFRFSRGLKKPEEVEMPYSMAKKILGAATPRYSSACTITIDDAFTQTISYEQYNISDIGCQDEISF